MRSVPLFWTVFASSSVLAVGLGAATMSQAGLSAGLWLRNPAAWLAGMALAWLVARTRWRLVWTPPIAVFLVALTFLSRGQDGVHRWIGLGPLVVNVAALALPVAVSALCPHRLLNAGCYVVALMLLTLQPDMSQLLAMVAAAIAFAGLTYGGRGAVAAILPGVVAIGICAVRPDPLIAVPHVEGIVQLAWSQSPFVAAAMVMALVSVCLSPLLLWPIEDVRARAVALAAYFGMAAATSAFGAFPVPLAGYGISFVLGWCLAVGCLLRRASEPGSASFSLHE